MGKQENQQVQKTENLEEKNKTLTASQVEVLLARQEEEIIQRVTQSLTITTVRQGPIPSATELKEYKQIDKNLPSRIIEMAEREQRFRHKSTLIGQTNFIALITIGYGMSILAGVYAHWSIGVAIATGTSYIAYVFKSKDPNAPKQNSQKKDKED